MPAGPRTRLSEAGIGVTVSVGLLAVVLLQAPGRLLPETKADLVVAPDRFIGRASQLWDPSVGFGQLNNQLVGYLLPMGPFYWLFDRLAVPGWLIQRLWIGGLLVVGLWGVWRLASLVGLGTPAGRWLGAAAYVLGPASLTLVAYRSGTQVPMYLLPWVMVPLVQVDELGPRRAAAGSALVVALMGAVNGAATVLVLIVPGLWLVTRGRQRATLVLAAWWTGAVVLATAWWTGPLLLQRRYGYDFTAFTETAPLITAVAAAAETLRGTGNWLAYQSSDGFRVLPGGWELVASRTAIVGGFAVAAVGLAGLARRDLPERRWLVGCALVAAVGMGAGYAGPFGSPLAPAVRDLLDGPLVAVRSVFKLQPVLALPLALGVVHLLGVVRVPVGDRARRARGAAWSRPVAPLAVAGLVLLAAVPVLSGRLAVDGSFDGVPRYWRDAGAWLDDHAARRRSLIVPSAAFGEYRWGRPLDEPLVSVTNEPTAVRDVVPLGSNGTTRLMDGVGRLLDRGLPSEGLAPLLARSGVGFLVVRGDLDPARTDGPSLARMEATLAGSPGMERAVSFGPVQIWQVVLPVPLIAAYPAEELVVITGEPEALLAAAGVDGDAPVQPGDPVVLTGDAAGVPGLAGARRVVTDASRRRDVATGDVRLTASYTLAPGQRSPLTGAAPTDRLAVPSADHLATARPGPAEVTASSYWRTNLELHPGHQPWAAFDGDPATAWVPARTDAEPQLRLALDQPVPVGEVTVTAPANGGIGASEVVVSTPREAVTAPVVDGRATAVLAGDPTGELTVTVSETTGDDPVASVAGPAISEVTVPGLSLSRPIALSALRPAGVPASAPTTVVLSRDRTAPFDAEPDEDAGLDRLVTLDAPATYSVTGTAVALPGPPLSALLDQAGREEIDLPCGQGPPLRIDGVVVPTALTGTVADLRQGRLVDLRTCGPVALGPGEHRITTGTGGVGEDLGVRVADLVLDPVGPTEEPAPSRPVTVERWSDQARTVRIGPGGEAFLALTENANPGWEATLGGERLEPVRLDGWRQAWVVPAGAGGPVALNFTPGHTFRWTLVLGALGLAALVVLALVPFARRSVSRTELYGPRPGHRVELVVGIAAVAITGVALGGPLVLLAVPLVLVPRRAAQLPVIAAVATLGAGLVTLVAPGALPGSAAGAFSPGAQALAVLALLALAVSLLPDRQPKAAESGKHGALARRSTATAGERSPNRRS